MSDDLVILAAGTRPEIIKLAPVYKKLIEAKVPTQWLWTGQQSDIGPSAFEVFDIKPDWGLDLDAHEDDGLPELMVRLSAACTQAWNRLSPSWVIVQGDTMTTAAAGMTAFLRGIKVAHVEAGLRSWDIRSPYPEEACRVWVDAIADVKFAPTQGAAGLLEGEVYVTGNTVIDALTMVPDAQIHYGKYAVVTMHRRENATAVKRVCAAVKEMARSKVFEDIVWVMHPNPIVADVVPRMLKATSGVTLMPPLAYDQMVNLVRYASVLITDSGGLQEEALGLHVPCLVIRKETERGEGIATGGARLVGTDAQKLVGWASWLMHDREAWEEMSKAKNPYGDGRASERIAAIMRAKLKGAAIDKKLVSWRV